MLNETILPVVLSSHHCVSHMTHYTTLKRTVLIMAAMAPGNDDAMKYMMAACSRASLAE